jgi:Flp pilus assembly protein TadD
MNVRLVRLDGKESTLATTGRPAVIAFWSPDDESSPRLMAALTALDGEHPGRIRVAGVCVDTADPAAALALAEKEGAGFNLFAATPELLADWFGPDVEPELPTTFVFDATGALRRAVVGRLDLPTVSAVITSLLDDDVFIAELVRKVDWQLMQGDTTGAFESLRSALRGDVRDPRAHQALGKLYVVLDDIEKAEVAFQRAAELDPGLGEAQFNLGAARMLLQKYPAAVQAFEAAWEARGDHRKTLMALGDAYVACGRLEPALQVFERVRTQLPEDAPAWYMSGCVLRDLGRTAEARQALEKALEYAPELEEARRVLDSLG